MFNITGNCLPKSEELQKKETFENDENETEKEIQTRSKSAQKNIDLEESEESLLEEEGDEGEIDDSETGNDTDSEE